MSQNEVDEIVSFIDFKDRYLDINYHSCHSHFHFLVIFLFPQSKILHFIIEYDDCSVLGIQQLYTNKFLDSDILVVQNDQPSDISAEVPRWAQINRGIRKHQLAVP